MNNQPKENKDARRGEVQHDTKLKEMLALLHKGNVRKNE